MQHKFVNNVCQNCGTERAKLESGTFKGRTIYSWFEPKCVAATVNGAVIKFINFIGFGKPECKP